jgi:hypothetical protein
VNEPGAFFEAPQHRRTQAFLSQILDRRPAPAQHGVRRSSHQL